MTPSSLPPPRPAASPIATAHVSEAPPSTPTVAATGFPTPMPAPPAASLSPAEASPSPAPAPAARSGIEAPIALAAAVVALLAIGWVALRRRSAHAPRAIDAPSVAAEPAAAIARARLTMTFRPIRAGLNLLSAASENEVVLANVGDVPAEDIRVLIQLASVHTGHEPDLAAIYAATTGCPAVSVFTLVPGEERAITSATATPRDAIRALTAAGRPMFVPLVAVNILYTTGETEAQLAQAFAIGVQRVDSAKLAPIWLDVPPRTYDQVAVRRYAAAVER